MNTAQQYDSPIYGGSHAIDQGPTNYNDYFSASPSPSIKRAKSVRDAFPPSPTGTPSISLSSRSRSYFYSKDFIKRKSDDMNSFSRSIGHRMTLSFDSSDAESLPDLSDSISTTSSNQSVTTPQKPLSSSFSFIFTSPIPSRNIPYEAANISKPPQIEVSKPSIFEIPELVYKIIEYADAQNTVIPKEAPPARRKPLSLQHATLLHDGDVNQAKKAMERADQPRVGIERGYSALHTCLLVNKLFNRIAKEVMGAKIIFSKEESFSLFANSDSSVFASTKPEVFVLDKLFYARQASLQKLAETIDYSSLHYLQIFMCPRLSPPTTFLHASLKSFIVTGSKVLDDLTMVVVAEKCPNLEVLDVRACEGITDYGIYSIGTKCRKLRSINIGRKRKGHLITDHSVSVLAANNPNLDTVGLAGCHVTDRTIWQLAMSCGKHIERLSLNNCLNLTDQSVPVVLSHNLMPKLSVLEIRFIENITNFDSIVTFKRRQNARGLSVLIETCEKLLYRLKASEKKMDTRIARRIFQDISEWANKDDEDTSYEEFIRARGGLIEYPTENQHKGVV
ncbi:hypothetical protein JCM33374_g508 [Metschnikowia sp. JCM 33374]|nr:hypothetical protein JCM33374_g508 [Metschnikowia sp. JCM 33374]